MGDYRVIGLKERTVWQEALECCREYDIYHRAQYHQADECVGEPILFWFTHKGHSAAVPMVLRNISETPGFAGVPYRDATSVYGYPGIISSVPPGKGEDFCLEFHKAWQEFTIKESIVSFFTRLNPFISSQWLLEGLMDIRTLGATVAVDLRQGREKRLAGMSKGHRYDIRKSRQKGVQVREDKELKHLSEFVDMYRETMERAGAASHYYFPRDYYLRMKDCLGEDCRLYVAELNNRVVSASFFLFSPQVIHYHLSGTFQADLCWGGGKVILDELAGWGEEHGYAFLHLGGGLGGQNDSLMTFKRGFSHSMHSFTVARQICNESVYQELVEIHRQRQTAEKRETFFQSAYFPLYRLP